MIPNNITTEFNVWYRKDADYTKAFSEQERQLINWLCTEFPISQPNELAFAIEQTLVNYRFLDIGYEAQKEYSNLLTYADKIANDHNPANFKITWYGYGNGECYELPGLIDNHKKLFSEYKKHLMQWAAYLKNQPQTQYLGGKNYFIRKLTKELYNFLLSRFGKDPEQVKGLGTDQSKYVIGYIYCQWNIYLETPILTESEFDKKVECGKLSHETYRDYLKSKIDACLKNAK